MYSDEQALIICFLELVPNGTERLIIKRQTEETTDTTNTKDTLGMESEQDKIFLLFLHVLNQF